MFDLGDFNLQRAHLIITTLKSLGVRYFCVAPGSRSTSLALAVGTLPDEYRCIHFDERGLAFHALGFAKASGSPVAIIVTTGTAVANLFPAVAESSLAGVPLILLTADRPPELQDCGSNQTMNQAGVFNSFTRWAIELPVSDPLVPDAYLLSSLSYAVFRSMYGPKGPVQINCSIREPFFSNQNFASPLHPACVYEPVIKAPPLSSFKKWAELLSQYNSGIILLGSDAVLCDPSCIVALAEKTGWPIFSDVLSGGRQIGDHSHHIEYFDILIKALPDSKIDAVLQIGSRVVSKTVSNWIANQKAAHFLVCDHSLRQDPHSTLSYRMECETSVFCSTLISFLPERKENSASFWKNLSRISKQTLCSFFAQEPLFSEPYIAHFFKDFPRIFVSNSMPVRDADMFIFPDEGNVLVMANRGVSGIDGNIATAVGAATALKQPLVALLGDMASLHDLNSLALVKQSPVPIFLVIINNNGGGIFSFLPVAEKKAALDSLFATEHSYSFKAAAELFSLPFFSSSSIEELKTAWQQAQGASCIIECKTVRADNVLHHKTLYEKVKRELCNFLNPSEIPVTRL